VLYSFILYMHTNKAGRKTQWVARNKKYHATKTDFVAHTLHQSASLNFIRLNNSDRNSGVKLGIYNGARKAQAEIAGMSRNSNLHHNSTRPPIGPI